MTTKTLDPNSCLVYQGPNGGLVELSRENCIHIVACLMTFVADINHQYGDRADDVAGVAQIYRNDGCMFYQDLRQFIETHGLGEDQSPHMPLLVDDWGREVQSVIEAHLNPFFEFAEEAEEYEAENDQPYEVPDVSEGLPVYPWEYDPADLETVYVEVD